MEMYRRTFAEIDLDALEANIKAIRSHFPAETFFCPMVKANAYGHGDVIVARALEAMGVRHVGVCLIEEGLLLRNFGVKIDILVFRGFDREGARKILQYNMTPVVTSWEQLEHLLALATNPVRIHLKFDTGMNRLGFPVSEAKKLFEKLEHEPRLKVDALVTHLFEGEDGDRDDGNTVRQLRLFHEAARVFAPMNPVCHALNSAGIVRKIESRGLNKEHPLHLRDWGLRPGLMIYGMNPIARGAGLDLQPVMTLRSQAGVLRALAPGESVSYNGTWKAKRDSVVAVVPIGYADGYHRLLSNRAEALFGGVRVPVVGNVCMDYLMLDVTDALKKKPLAPGHEPEIVLFGRSAEGAALGADELARHAQTIPWEIFTSVGERVPRRYKGRLARLVGEEPAIEDRGESA